MRFLAPWGFAFLGLIPLIIVFYLLRQKREPRVVSSTLLWEQVLADTMAQTPWQKLRRSLLLLLQLLIALLLALSLARPALVSFQSGGGDVIILLDTSASMAAVEDGGNSRLDEAKREIEKLLAEKGRGTSFTLIEVGAGPRVLAERTQDKSQISRGLKQASPGLFQSNLESALSLVMALQKKDSQVVFFSDGGAVLPELPVGLADFQYRRTGSREDNLAMGAFSLQSSESLALTRIDNYGSQEAETTVRLFAGDKLADVQRVKAPPGRSAYLFWNVPPDAAYLEARLEGPDALAADDTAWLVPGLSRKAQALLVSQGNIFLEQALKLSPLLDLHRIKPDEYQEVKDKYTLYVFDGFWPQELPPGALIVVNPPSASGLVQEPEAPVGKVEGAGDGPLVRNLSWADVNIAKSKGIKTNPQLQPLLRDGEKTVIAAGKLAEARVGVFGFDLHQSDLPLRPAFPILMQNLLNWLVPAGSLSQSNTSVANRPDYSLQPEASDAFLTRPDGSKIALKQPAGKLPEVSLPGIYRFEQTIQGETRVEYLAVNFAAPEESKVKPLAQVKLRLKDVETGPGSSLNWEFWPWLILVVLTVLAVEWWVYLRGH